MRHVPKLVALLTVVAATLTSTAGLADAATPSLSAVTPAWGTYQSLTPARVLDTRYGDGAPKAPIGPGGIITLPMLGNAGVPTTGVSAVVLNVTATAATKAGYLKLWPAGTAQPTATNINFVAGVTRGNLMTVPLGTIGANNGKISIYNLAGTVQVVADVMGYYVADETTTAGGLYQEGTPTRMLDTRDPSFGGPLLPDWYVSVPVDYNDPTPGTDINSHVRALAVNITAVSPTKPGYLTVWDGGSILPTTSALNFTPGATTPNMAIIPVGPCVDCGTGTGLPSVSILNNSLGSVHLVVDVVGFFDDGQLGEGLRFKPLAPTRIVDTRSGLGTTTLSGNQTKSVTAPASVAGDATWALVTNSAAVRPTMSTNLILWAGGDLQPLVSNLNVAKGQIVANATITNVGMGNVFNIFNTQGVVDVVVDVVGTMEYIPNAAPPAARATASEPRTWTPQVTSQPARSLDSRTTVAPAR